MRKEIPEEKKKFAVARILARKSSAAEEAERLGVSPQAVRDWVRKMRPPDPAPPPRAPLSSDKAGSGGAQPPGLADKPAPGAEPAPEDPLARARAAAGIPAGAGPAALPNADALRAAEQADKELVISTAIDAKRAVVTFVGVKAGLDPEDPALEKISGLTPIAASALQANASWLAPMIREKLQGKFALLGALAIEAVATLAALKRILKARGLDKDKDEVEPEKEKPGGAPHPPA